jgi:hypothetical protein
MSDEDFVKSKLWDRFKVPAPSGVSQLTNFLRSEALNLNSPAVQQWLFKYAPKCDSSRSAFVSTNKNVTIAVGLKGNSGSAVQSDNSLAFANSSCSAPVSNPSTGTDSFVHNNYTTAHRSTVASRILNAVANIANSSIDTTVERSDADVATIASYNNMEMDHNPMKNYGNAAGIERRDKNSNYESANNPSSSRYTAAGTTSSPLAPIVNRVSQVTDFYSFQSRNNTSNASSTGSSNSAFANAVSDSRVTALKRRSAEIVSGSTAGNFSSVRNISPARSRSSNEENAFGKVADIDDVRCRFYKKNYFSSLTVGQNKL